MYSNRIIRLRINNITPRDPINETDVAGLPLHARFGQGPYL